MDIRKVSGAGPCLVLEDYFLGRTRAWGIFQDRFGNLRRQFTVDIAGRMEDGALILEEDFAYADGETDRRVWRIEKTGPHEYNGRADDIVGAAQGRVYGNVLNWRYTMNLPIGDRLWEVCFDDWMFLQQDNVLINRAEISKFGITLGEVTITFGKEDRRAEPEPATR